MIADSSAWIELLRATGSRAHLRLRHALQRGEEVLMLDVIYQEVLQGATDPRAFARLQAMLDELGSCPVPDSRDLALHAASLYARCRWRGFPPRSSNDCIIAAAAVAAGEDLLHADRDFERIAQVEPRLQFA